ncbi:hypothetical protein BJ875DRAFT_90146 [Amylocarpus encephaloides]|uniref:DUF8035 domain-containing protein n=1 Tax=Amylocarpus encephaloides TaxID=45428 RepID=A0A9P7YEN8_9HELO|nr:hypothetical protein BJ875DRAFT_90146 [Amylocarpus encephaloides]
MSRRGEAVYEDREYYSREGPAPVRTQVRERDFEETDVYSRRGPESARGSRPDFLRDDYGRQDPGQVVVREHDTEVIGGALQRRPRSPSPVRIRERERVIRRSPSPPPVDRETTFRSRVVGRERARSLTPPPPERLRARVTETRERVRERSPSPIRYRERIVERERERSPSPVRVVRTERIVERERQRSPSPPQIDTVRIRKVERETRRIPSPSPSPSPPPPPPQIRAPPIHQEIITHHRHIDHGFERARVPSPPSPPRRPKETKETDIDIHTSRNNTEIDIKQTSRSRTPQPNSFRRHDFYDDDDIYEHDRDKLKVSDARLALGRRRSLSARPEIRERDRVKVDIRESYSRERDDHFHDRSLSIRGDEDEAEYYRRKADERAYIGEAYNGATKDWAIVDVPPGTERVKMDGVGGGSQEITWQRYNGVRRSKFIPERERERERIPEPVRERERIEIREREEPRQESSGLEIEISSSSRRQGGGTGYEREYERIEETTNDRRVGLPRPPTEKRRGDLWTEITKDLVVEEAIKELGYDYEETEFFYYVIQYLRYEDVLELVQLSEHIKKERQHRLREIERERERFERRAREREDWERLERRRERDCHYDDERIIEREIIYDEGGRRRRRGGW